MYKATWNVVQSIFSILCPFQRDLLNVKLQICCTVVCIYINVQCHVSLVIKVGHTGIIPLSGNKVVS